MGYPNGMERQAIAIRFSLPVASANSLHSLFKARAALAHEKSTREIIIRHANHVTRGKKCHEALLLISYLNYYYKY